MQRASSSNLSLDSSGKPSLLQVPSGAQQTKPAIVQNAGNTLTAITSDILNTIFMNVEDIQDMHRAFSLALHQAADGWDRDRSCIGSAISAMARQIPSNYTPYCNGFGDSRAQLKLCMSNAAFASYVDNVQSLKELHRHDLAALLILPIQRVPRYELLLRDLLRHTEAEHADFASLTAALAHIKDEATRMNRSKAFQESKRRIISLNNQMSGVKSMGSAMNLSVPPTVDFLPNKVRASQSSNGNLMVAQDTPLNSRLSASHLSINATTSKISQMEVESSLE